jgi:hypothetical protein
VQTKKAASFEGKATSRAQLHMCRPRKLAALRAKRPAERNFTSAAHKKEGLFLPPLDLQIKNNWVCF